MFLKGFEHVLNSLKTIWNHFWSTTKILRWSLPKENVNPGNSILACYLIFNKNLEFGNRPNIIVLTPQLIRKMPKFDNR